MKGSMGAGLQRIPAIDAIRGLALLGIFYVHMHDFYNGYPSAGGEGWWNEGATWIYCEVFLAKAYAVFSFLFGVSFALQLGRAEARGMDFRGRFLWRLVLLFAFGVINTLFYGGDILLIFAVFGAVLVPCWRARPWVVAVVAGLLTVQIPLWIDALHGCRGGTAAPWVQMFEAHVTPMPDCMTATWGSLARWNVSDGLWVRLAYMIASGRLVTVLAMFLWGMLAVRCGLAGEGRRPRRFWQWGAAAALLAYAVLTWGLPLNAREGEGGAPSAWEPLMVAWRNDAAVVLFLSVCFLFLGKPHAGTWTLPFRAAGRMSLSCYLAQSVMGTCLLFGWGAGLAPSLSAFEAALWCVGLFAVQAAACRWWLLRYRYGPLEWLWRCGTYGRLQPMRREGAEPHGRA